MAPVIAEPDVALCGVGYSLFVVRSSSVHGKPKCPHASQWRGPQQAPDKPALRVRRFSVLLYPTGRAYNPTYCHTGVSPRTPWPQTQCLAAQQRQRSLPIIGIAGCWVLRPVSSLRTYGAFSHSANYYAVYPGNTPENHPPTEPCMIHSKQHRGCRIQDPGTRGHRWWKTADFSHSARCAPLVPPCIFFRFFLRWCGSEWVMATLVPNQGSA